MIPKHSRNVELERFVLHGNPNISECSAFALKVQDVQDEKGPPYSSDVAEHVVLNTSLH